MSWFERQLVKFLPAGEIKAYAGATAPSFHLLCDGTAYSRTDYARLFRAISTTYGVGDGSTTFNVPDLQQVFPMGKSAAESLADTGGTFNHTHTAAAHTHTGAAHTHTGAAHTHTGAFHDHTSAAHTHGGGTLHATVYAAGTVLALDTMASSYSTDVAATVSFSGDSTVRDLAAKVIGNSASTTPGNTGGQTPGAGGSTTPGAGGSTTPGAGGSTTPGASGTGDPPYLVVNYIIRI